jgi:hypothetical protein
MKLIFWTNIYDGGGIEYIEKNQSLIDLSQKHEIFGMANGKKCQETMKHLYNRVTTIECINDRAAKGKAIFDHFKGRDDYDFLIRIDLDAIVFDLNRLETAIEKNMLGKHAVMGNTKTFYGRRKENKKYRGTKYVRGACNVASRSVVEAIEMITDENAGFDIPFAMSFKGTGCEVISNKLFELNKRYTGKRPVWHPPYKGTEKLRYFLKGTEQYVQGTKNSRTVAS